MKSTIKMRTFVSLLLTCCLLVMPLTVLAKKGDAHYKKGLQYETAQQWEQAAQEFTLAVVADPANTEYQLHFRRASFNASQAFMQQGARWRSSAITLARITPFARRTAMIQ